MKLRALLTLAIVLLAGACATTGPIGGTTAGSSAGSPDTGDGGSDGGGSDGGGSDGGGDDSGSGGGY